MEEKKREKFFFFLPFSSLFASWLEAQENAKAGRWTSRKGSGRAFRNRTDYWQADGWTTSQLSAL